MKKSMIAMAIVGATLFSDFSYAGQEVVITPAEMREAHQQMQQMKDAQQTLTDTAEPLVDQLNQLARQYKQTTDAATKEQIFHQIAVKYVEMADALTGPLAQISEDMSAVGATLQDWSQKDGVVVQSSEEMRQILHQTADTVGSMIDDIEQLSLNGITPEMDTALGGLHAAMSQYQTHSDLELKREQTFSKEIIEEMHEYVLDQQSLLVSMVDGFKSQIDIITKTLAKREFKKSYDLFFDVKQGMDRMTSIFVGGELADVIADQNEMSNVSHKTQSGNNSGGGYKAKFAAFKSN